MAPRWVGDVARDHAGDRGRVQIIAGLVANIEGDFDVTTARWIFELDVTARRWIHLIAGEVLVALGAGILTGNLAARMAGVVTRPIGEVGTPRVRHEPIAEYAINLCFRPRNERLRGRASNPRSASSPPQLFERVEGRKGHERQRIGEDDEHERGDRGMHRPGDRDPR